MGPPVRLGIVGAGWWSTLAHAPAALRSPDAELVAVADPNRRRRELYAQRFAVPAGFASHRELIDACAVDALVVASPPATHFEVARAALQAGLHVLVEKPIAVRTADADELLTLARDAELRLNVGYALTYTDAARRLRRALRDGALGDVELATILYASPINDLLEGAPRGWVGDAPQGASYADPELAGGGQALAQLTHPVHLLLWLTESSPTWVSAELAEVRPGIDRVDAALFRLDSGAVGTAAATGRFSKRQKPQQELRVFGTAGAAGIDIADMTLSCALADGSHLTATPAANEEAYPREAPLLEFVSAIRRDAPMSAPSAARSATAFVEALYKSAASEGRRVAVSGPGP